MASRSHSIHDYEEEPEMSPVRKRSRRSSQNKTTLHGRIEDGPLDIVSVENGWHQMEDIEENGEQQTEDNEGYIENGGEQMEGTEWPMENGEEQMEDTEGHMENGEQQMEDTVGPMENGGQQMEDTEEDLPVVMTYRVILPDYQGGDSTKRSATIFMIVHA